MATITPPVFSIEDFLAEERDKDLLRFSTAGSVDDGKSTLIGRLLYDTQSVYEDQVTAIKGKGTTAPGQIDFALLTDGLRAEREQGITIDVAYRYFATSHRKFIIADTPGHEQYTRNMATGASTADATVVLIDASKGLIVQSRRHAYIASLLKVRHVIVAVNKMDLVGYDEGRFFNIRDDFTKLQEQISEDTGNNVAVTFIPVSALDGDNVVRHSGTMPWYAGPTLLEALESVPLAGDRRRAPFRFPVQRVLRPNPGFRGYAGQIASGTVRLGDGILLQPSGRTAKVSRIVTFDGDLDEAASPLSITLVLDRELDISRGDLMVSVSNPAKVTRYIQGPVVWMDEQQLQLNRKYLLKHTSQTVPAVVLAVDYRTDVATLRREPAESLQMNQIGVVSLQLARPLAVDTYGENRGTGAFVLIDSESNRTIAAGMVSATVDRGTVQAESRDRSTYIQSEERARRWGHYGGVLALAGSTEIFQAIERALWEEGYNVATLQMGRDYDMNGIESIERWATSSGLLLLLLDREPSGAAKASANGHEVDLEGKSAAEIEGTVAELLLRAGILLSTEKGG